MVFVRPLGADERRALKRLARRAVGRVSERLRMILLASRGDTVPQIAEICESAEAPVRRWITRCEAEGVQGLRDRPRAGRPWKADAAARAVIRSQVETSPAEAGDVFGFWTVVTLGAHLAGCGLHRSEATVRRALHALDFRWRRPRHALPRDPEAARPMWALCARVLRAPAEAVLLGLDECALHLLPVPRAMWMRRGQHVCVPTPGTTCKRSLFGALEWTTGRWLSQVCERKRAVEFLAFLEQWVVAYPGRPLLRVLDHASIHTAQVVQAWLVEHPPVELLFLPADSGHAQNPVEKVWWRLKDRVAAHRLHGSIESLVAAVHDFFASFTPEAARQLAA